MDAVTVSSKYQIVIPRRVREQLDIRPGQKVSVVVLDGQMRIVPIRPVAEYRGMLKGVENTFERDEDDRF